MADDITAQIQQAKGAGYSDDQIVTFLATKRPDLAPKIVQAKQAKYSSTDIIQHLGQPAKDTVEPDVIQRALNYHPENPIADTALGVVEGAGKGLMSTATGAMKLGGIQPKVDPGYIDSITKPEGPGQGTGKFLEQAAEYAVPSGLAGKAMKGAGLAARVAAQAGIGAGVSAVQSGGDPTDIATGAALGGLGEVAKPAIAGIKMLSSAPPTLENFAKAMGATPTQKSIITRAMPMLLKDGLSPAASVPEMQAAVKGQLANLGGKYAALPADLTSRTMDALDVAGELQKAQNKFVSANGHILSENRAAYDMLARQINDVVSVADQNSGKISFKDLKDLRDAANGKTNFASTDSQHDLFREVGDVYRSALDKIAPETTPLNRDWAQYRNLETMVDKNVGMGRGTTQSGLESVIEHASNRTVGAGLGAAAGHFTGIPGASWLGAALGAAAYPKLAEGTVTVIKNVAASGALQNASAPVRASLTLAIKAGDNEAIQRILKRLPVEAVQTARDQ